MRPYEVMLIFSADLDEETIRSVVERSAEQVRAAGGEVGAVDHWGKRRFAYELQHRREGYYVLLRARAEPAVIREVDRALFLSDEVLRHRVVGMPEGASEQEPAVAEAQEG